MRYGFSNWEGKSVSEHIKNKFDIILKVHRYQFLLHHLGFTLQRYRYVFLKADTEEREQFNRDFKKT
ncbi:MAG: winged helix-turn-helix domain-containing protein [Promethearchaeota archaeon]